MRPQTFYFQVVIVILLSLVGSEARTEFLRANFVSWTPNKINVLGPKQEFHIKVKFTDPCPTLRKQFKHSYSAILDNPTGIASAFLDRCSVTYDTQIIQKLDFLSQHINSTQHRRNKRSVALLGLFGGIWLSNVIDSVFHDNDRIAEREEQQNAALAQLNKRQNFSDSAIFELAKNQHFLIDKVNELARTTNETIRQALRMQFAANSYQNHFNEKSEALNNLRYNLISKKKIDFQALNSFLDTHVFETIDPDSADIISIDKVESTGSYRSYIIKFYGHLIDQKLRIYDVHAMTHWTNLTQSPSMLLEYGGPKNVLVNSEKNCVIGLSEPEEVTGLSCDENNMRATDLDVWIPVRPGNPFSQPIKTKFVEALPSVIIYCIGRQITISKQPPIDCPPFAFKLSATTQWKTDDKKFPGISTNVLSFSINLPENIIPAEIQEPNNTQYIEIDALKKIYKLTALLEEEQKKALVLTTPIGGVSHSTANKIILGGVATLFCLVIWMWRHNHLHIRDRHVELMKNISVHIDKTMRPSNYPVLPVDGEPKKDKDDEASW